MPARRSDLPVNEIVDDTARGLSAHELGRKYGAARDWTASERRAIEIEVLAGRVQRIPRGVAGLKPPRFIGFLPFPGAMIPWPEPSPAVEPRRALRAMRRAQLPEAA